MRPLLVFLAFWTSVATAQERTGISATMPGREFRVLQTTYAPESLHVRPGTVHAHRNAGTTERLVFLEFVVVDKGQRSTVALR